VFLQAKETVELALDHLARVDHLARSPLVMEKVVVPVEVDLVDLVRVERTEIGRESGKQT
jgi:hypothetical protein